MNVNLIYQAIDAEEELDGEMPDDIWVRARQDKNFMLELMRESVRLTKKNIRERIEGLFSWKIAFKAAISGEKPEHLRRGQWMFNELHKVNPELADKIRCDVNDDPFFSDNKIERFLIRVLCEN